MPKHLHVLCLCGLISASLLNAAPVASLYAFGSFYYTDQGSLKDVGFQESSAIPVAEVSGQDTFTSEVGPFSGSYFAQAQFGQVRFRTTADGIPGNKGGSHGGAFADDYITVIGAPEGSIS
jgi:hypothetical protein